MGWLAESGLSTWGSGSYVVEGYPVVEWWMEWLVEGGGGYCCI
jgi:hypothetical protein